MLPDNSNHAQAAEPVEKWGVKRQRSWRAREREPITGVWGQSPQRGPGAEPLVRGSGGEAPEAEKLLAFAHPTETGNLSFLSIFRQFFTTSTQSLSHYHDKVWRWSDISPHG